MPGPPVKPIVRTPSPTPDRGFRDANLAAPTPPAKTAKPVAPVRPPVPRGPRNTPAPTPPQATAPAPIEKPNPALQAQGFQGGINAFNQRVQAVHDAYNASYGQPPSPGLVFDLAKSPVDTGQFPSMFTVPLMAHQAAAQGAISSLPAHSTMVVRPDGYQQPSNPVAPIVQAHPNYAALEKKNPWVAAGMLPVGNDLLQGFWKALADLGNNPDLAKPLLYGSMTVDQFSRENDLANSLNATSARQGRRTSSPDVQAQQAVATGVTNVKQVQQKLQQLAPEYFNHLPVTGLINSDWAKGIQQYTSSTKFFRQQTVQLATDNHFGTDTAAFIKAWRFKQGAIRKYPEIAHLVSSLPLAAFGNADSFRNYLTGNTKGLGWVNVPTWGLNLLGHTVQLAASEIGATIDTVKVDAAAASAYLQALQPKGSVVAGFPVPGAKGATQAQAVALAHKVLRENPTWARVFNPDDNNAVQGQVVNAALDLFIGAPGFTGERVLAGDIGKLSQNRYFKSKTTWAFNTLAQKGDAGVAEAALTLEGGAGAEKLAHAYAAQIKAGEMSLPEFQQRAAELYAHGRTTVPGATPATAAATVSIPPRGALPNSARISQLVGLGVDKAAAESITLGETVVSSFERKVAEATNPQARAFHEQQLEGQRRLLDKALTKAQPVAQSAPAEPVAITGPLLRSLRGHGIPTKGPVGLSVEAVRGIVKESLDNWEQVLRARKQGIGGTSHAADFMTTVRQAVAKAAPNGPQILSDERLPQDIYNWTVKHLKDRTLADTLRNDFVRARAADDVQGMVAVNERLKAAYAAANPDKKMPENPFAGSQGPLVESEMRSYFQFPSTLDEGARAVNAQLNKIAAKHRQVIVGGSPNPLIAAPAFVPGGGFIPGFGEVLAFKHIAADTTRRVAGGGGILGSLSPEVREIRAEVEAHLKDNPATIRTVGTNRSQAIMGEQRWITGHQYESPQNYNTGAVLNDKNKLTGAGGYLRHLLSSDALHAYQASTKDDLGPLVSMILKDKAYRARMGATDAYMEGVAKLRLSLGKATPAEREQALNQFNLEHAHAYAELIWKQYNEVERAGVAAGLTDPLGSALGELVGHVGPKADEKLGSWIKQNQLDFPVRDGLVENPSRWDATMSKWINRLMVANKWNRGQLFDHVFYTQVGQLTNAGWKMEHAIPVAADLAKAQTVYHMLDFSNMLQVEQDLRWLSYFATKHRLYWTWVGKYITRHPGSAAIINDVSKSLDNKGNLQMTLFGRRIYVPVARLFWVNSRDYPQTSPIVQFGAEFGKNMVEGKGPGAAASGAVASLTSTSGNLITRDDQAEMYALKLAGVATGTVKPSAAAVTAGMATSQINSFNASVNEYANLYHADHGTWPSEADAVKHVLLHTAAQQGWNSNLPLPFTWHPEGSETPKVKAQMDAYGRILDPAKKRAYLDTHPAVALRFGISKDPAVYLHNAPLWDKFNADQSWLKAQRQAIWQDILKNGFTANTKVQMKALSGLWQQKLDALKMEDASTWAGTKDFPAGRVSDGLVVTPGPWGTQLEGDPLAANAFVHQAFPGVPNDELNSHTVTQRIVDLQAEAARLRAATTPAKIAALGYPDAQHVRDRISQINTIIAPFFAYPKDAPAQAQSDYYTKFVTPYIKARDEKSAALKLLPTDQQDAARSAFREWKDSFNHSVKLTVDGHVIKFPSVVQIGWATLPKDQVHLGLASAVSGDWAHVASYEKTMLGVKAGLDVSEGWSAFATAVRDYSKNPSNSSLVQAQKVGLARQIDKVYPGFYKDFLFSLRPKIERFQATSLYQQMPDRKLFDVYVTGPAKQMLRAISANGSRTYYEKAWRQYIETQVTPWLDTQPQLKADLAAYGPDFLNTLVSH